MDSGPNTQMINLRKFHISKLLDEMLTNKENKGKKNPEGILKVEKEHQNMNSFSNKLELSV